MFYNNYKYFEIFIITYKVTTNSSSMRNDIF